MSKLPQDRLPTRHHSLTTRLFASIKRFLHIEAMSGIILIIAAAAALIWANSSFSESYENFWRTTLNNYFSAFPVSWDLRFFINDVLMALFFLVAGMEIRREIYDGALSNLKQASLPVIAAFGGVLMPAVIYTLLNLKTAQYQGWAVPTATDIAFAVGILALLGKAIPDNVRIILLSLAIIDDIIAVLIIALFYSGGMDINGLAIGCLAVLLVIFMQRLNISNAWFYCLPGVILWCGLYKAGIHPSLSGVILGMLTPVLPARGRFTPLKWLQTAVHALQKQPSSKNADRIGTSPHLKKLHTSQPKLLAPVTRVQMALHPWVAYAIMPLFAFANAGVVFSGLQLHEGSNSFIATGIIFGLFIGKPLGVFTASFLAVKSGLCRLPPQVNWAGIALIGFLAGIGFTMAIFVAMLAFNNPNQLAIAKVSVLSGSALSAVFSLFYGLFYIRHLKQK